MRKLIKLTALFTLLLLFYGTAFGGGWQKILNDAPLVSQYPEITDLTGFYSMEVINKYLPTKDGGVLIYGSDGNGRSGGVVAHVPTHRITKIDKFGNYVWDKFLFKNDIYNSQDTIISSVYDPTYSDVINIIEIRNGIYVVEHRGKYYSRNINTQNGWVEDSTYDHGNLRYFTFIDKYGNIIKTVYNNNDIIELGSDYNGNVFYDSIQNKVEIFALKNANGNPASPRLYTKRTYDTAFHLLSIDTLTTIIPFKFYGYLIKKEKNNYYFFNPRAKENNNDTCRILKLDENYHILIDKKISIENMYDSIIPLFSQYFTCVPPQFSNDFFHITDYYLDENENLYFSFIVKIYCYASQTSNNQLHIPILCVIKIDKNGNIVQKIAKDISSIVGSSYQENVQIEEAQKFIFKSNNILTLLSFRGDSGGDYWLQIQIDLISEQVVKSKKINLLDINGFKQGYDYSLFLKSKLKSPVDNSYFTILNYSKLVNSTAIQYGAVIKFDSVGNAIPYIIKGNVFADQNNNCKKNTTDNSLPQVTVTAQNNNNTAFTSSDNNGNYFIGVSDSGLYTVTAQPNINYPLFAQGNCAVQTSYAYLDSFTVDTVNLNLKPTILCPNMYVDISTPMLRRCFSNIYTVNYKNNGTVASPNTFIDVALDRFLTVNSASIAYTNLGNNVLRFNLGNVDYLSSGRFTIDVTVRCDSTIVGQTHCVEAHIYPDTVCAASGYTGPVISASAQCKQDSIEFKLRNSGGNMQNPKRYIVIEDNLNRLNGNYQLNNGQQKIVTIAADSGHTYGIIAEQDDAFPIQLGDKFATAFIEGCNPINGQFNTGFITQYPEFDGEPYRSVDCQQNRGAFDPNDKTGFPIGVSGQHYIEKNTAIDYKINFQNTGNDTAFKVVIVDTISKYLDINTIEPGASSHRYTYMRTDSNTIKFIFENIKLVDSNKNEKLSHGFVKFRIQQKQNNPNGTKIYNQAEIYFDYNASIFTNKTMHTIGDVYVRIISKTINPTYSKADVKIYPNPFRENVTIELQNMEPQNTNLILLDIAGNEILQLQSNNNKYEINGSNLAKGLYLFRIQNDKSEIANGKLMVQ